MNPRPTAGQFGDWEDDDVFDPTEFEFPADTAEAEETPNPNKD
jgi:hypothetical protein